MNLRRLAVLGLLLLVSALPVSAAVQITAQLSNIAGTLPQTAFLRLELFNCGANFPLITGSNYTVAQPSYDFHPVNGVVSGTVFGNDEITCGGVKSTAYHVTVMKDSNTPTGGDNDYLITTDLSPWNPVSAMPMVGPLPKPGFQTIFGNPITNQTILQPNGTTLFIKGHLDLTNAVVTGFAGGNGGSPVSVNSNLIPNPNFGNLPAAVAGYLNCAFAFLGSNISLACPMGNTISTFAPGLGSTVYAPLNNPTLTGHVTVPAPTTGTDAVNQAYADAAYAPLSGSLVYAPLNNPTLTGHVSVPTPTSGTDAVTKTYADSLISGGSNATQFQSVNVANTPPIDGYTWQYVQADLQWEPKPAAATGIIPTPVADQTITQPTVGRLTLVQAAAYEQKGEVPDCRFHAHCKIAEAHALVGAMRDEKNNLIEGYGSARWTRTCSAT